MSDPIADLIAREGLPPDYVAVVDRWWRPLATLLVERRRAADHPLLIGINGAQGSGKSTLCAFLEVLVEEQGLHAVTLSLDDIYLTKVQRRARAEQVHPLFATRGVPGTHDVFAGLDKIAKVLAGETPLLPRFDKAIDDRAPVEAWHQVDRPVDLLLFEGWCVGAQPQELGSLAEPVNALEAEDDADGRWRAAVNDELVSAYTSLFGPISLLVMLRAPGFESVRAWRQLQERKLRDRTGQGMSEGEVDRFIQHYERLTRHILQTLPERADVVIDIAEDQQVTGISGPAYRGHQAVS